MSVCGSWQARKQTFKVVMRNIHVISEAPGWRPFTLQVADLTMIYVPRDASKPKGGRQYFKQEAEKLED